MSEHYDFHYQPTGSGAISGQQVLQQTEDAINELGDYVNDNVGGAMDVAQQALETAQNAEQDAQTALDTANSFSSAIQSAQQDASTALSTAQTAQTTASNANNTAIQASQDASSAVTTANNASGQVSTLSGTVTALGQRVTTAEGNIGQNTSDITALTTRVGTAEGNITTLQNDVSIAQGNASSAMATAGQVKQQAFVFRYSSTALTASSTNSNSLLDNTDNLKVGDKVIDSNGVLFSITAIDTANSTFTIGTALIDLAQDSDVVHKSGNETITGIKTLENIDLPFKNSVAELGVSGGGTNITFSDKNGQLLCALKSIVFSAGTPVFQINLAQKVDNTVYTTNGIVVYQSANSKVIQVRPTLSNDNADGLKVELGSSANRYNRIYGLAYYYGSNNVEFSNKFVTTDTNQTISGVKTFSDSPLIYNSDSSASIPQITLKNQKVVKSSTTETGAQLIYFTDKNNNALGQIEVRAVSNGTTGLNITSFGFDSNNQNISSGVQILRSPTTANFSPNADNAVTCGRALARWSDVQTYKVNGLEPSSLSLPSNKSVSIDISSYFTNFGTGETNEYPVPANGYIYLQLFNVITIHCFVFESSTTNVATYIQTFSKGNDGQLYVLFPVRKNDIFKGTWYTTSTVTVNKAMFIPCQGNV